MKWFRSKKWLVFCLSFFLVIGQGSLLWAQPEDEEEEEPLQARPNPMEKTTLKDRTGISVKSGAPAKWDPFDKNPAMQKNQLVPPAGKGMTGMKSRPEGAPQMRGVPEGAPQMRGVPEGAPQMRGIPEGASQFQGRPEGAPQLKGIGKEVAPQL